MESMKATLAGQIVKLTYDWVASNISPAFADNLMRKTPSPLPCQDHLEGACRNSTGIAFCFLDDLHLFRQRGRSVKDRQT